MGRITAWWFDRPDPRDFNPYLFDFWASEQIADYVHLGKWMKIYNQHLDDYTSNACGSYGAAHNSNAMNVEEQSTVRIVPDERWSKFVAHFRGYYLEQYWFDPIKSGSFLQDLVRFLKEHEYITGRYVPDTVKECIEALDRWHAILTGSKRINRTKTRQEPYFADISSGSAHIFGVVWYSNPDRYFICVNSSWENRYDKWYFYVSFDDFWAFYTKYALLDKKDKQKLNHLRMKLALSKSLVAEEKRGNPISEENYSQYARYIDYWRANRKR